MAFNCAPIVLDVRGLATHAMLSTSVKDSSKDKDCEFLGLKLQARPRQRPTFFQTSLAEFTRGRNVFPGTAITGLSGHRPSSDDSTPGTHCGNHQVAGTRGPMHTIVATLLHAAPFQGRAAPVPLSRLTRIILADRRPSIHFAPPNNPTTG